MEIYRNIEGYPNYQVSNTGKVRSLDHIAYCKDGRSFFVKGRILKENISTDYNIVQLCKDGVLYAISVHRLVAQTFIPNPDNLPCVNHKNEDKRDNRVENLEWCSYEYNNNYGTKRERVSKSMMGNVPWNKGGHHSEESRKKMSESRKKMFENKNINN